MKELKEKLFYSPKNGYDRIKDAEKDAVMKMGEDYIKFIHVLGENIASTHISDYDFKDERHWLPGEGQIDWQALLLALKEVGYDKMWLYEIGLNAPWTIKRERALLISDFSENARAIFNGNAPKPLGTPTL